MAKEAKKLAEVEVLTPEQIEAFPSTVKKNIQFLSEEMNPRDLIEFNPLVSSLLNLREVGSKLKMRNPSPDGDFDKDNIQDFIDLKKDIRSYRAEVKRSAKKLKDPYNKIQKGIVAIEKVFIEEATTIYDNAEKEFELYLEAERKKAAEKEAEKNRELLEAAAKAEEEAAAERLKSEKTEVYNFIKYQEISENIKTKAFNAVATSNERSLNELYNEIESKTFESISKIRDISILDEEIITELKNDFETSKKNSLTVIKDKLLAYKLEREKEALEARQANPIPELEKSADEIDNSIPASVPAPPGGRVVQTYKDDLDNDISDEEFLVNMKDRIDVISRLISDRIKIKPMSSPQIYKLGTLINSLKNSI